MYRLSIIITVLLLTSIYNLPLCQPFPCDGSLLFSTNIGGPTTSINKVYFGPFGAVSFSPFYNYLGDFNSLGFNPQDNYIYAVRTNSHEIVRLKADNSFDVLGTVAGLDQLTSTAGDCTPDGYYLCHDQTLDQILVFEVVNNFELVNQIDLFWDPISDFSGPFSARIDDFVIDPTNTTVAYSFQGNFFGSDLEPEEAKGYLLRINLDFQHPNIGMVTPIAKVPSDVLRKIGGLMFSSTGSLFAYGATTPGPDPLQNQLFSIDKFSGAVNPYTSKGPRGISIDACSCPYNLEFTNLADPNFALCTDSEVQYILTISNRFFKDIPNASITDTLPEGMIISDLSENIAGNIAEGAGIGTTILQLDKLRIPARSELTFTLKASIIDLPIDFVANQAFLTNLPETFGYEMVSDDPATVGVVGDATTIFADPQRLEDFTVDITHPEDCLNAGDGKVVISSPVLITGNEYDVNMRNEKFAEFTKKVTIQAGNTLVLDSLLPSEYTLYKITPNTSQCSFAMKDTTVTVKAPNEKIQAAVFTNSPICEGTDLELSAEVFPPEGIVQWKGPRFESTDLDIHLDQPTSEQSGTYELLFTHGICEQRRSLDIEIFPTIEANINSQEGYCERDTLQLLAEGNGILRSFIWTTPNGSQFTDQTLILPHVSFEQEGTYQVIIDNGKCRDTINKFIPIFPSPSLVIPLVNTSTFCEPLVLTPEVYGSTNLSYTWEPEEGLSCSDCPMPEVTSPLHSRFHLTVNNEFACKDSTEVFVALDKEKLLYIPTIFSPNNDGINDYFQVYPNCGIASIDNFQIFDRFGNLVYSKTDLTNFSDLTIFWDGIVNGRQASPSIYLWQIALTLIDDTKRNLEGDITLIR